MNRLHWPGVLMTARVCMDGPLCMSACLFSSPSMCGGGGMDESQLEWVGAGGYVCDCRWIQTGRVRM